MNKKDCALMARPLERYLRAKLPRDARLHFQRILDRDESLELDCSAGAFLISACECDYEDFLSTIVLWLYWRYRAGDCSVKIYRDALDSTWTYNNRAVVGAANDRRQLRAMFRIGKFPAPKHLPEVVDIWRGTCGVTLDWARKGFSWSINRDVACWFAFRTPRYDPLVIRATVARNALFQPYDWQDEREVICFDCDHAVVDGDPTDWKVAASRRTAEIWGCTNATTSAGTVQGTGSVAMVAA